MRVTGDQEFIKQEIKSSGDAWRCRASRADEQDTREDKQP